MLHDIVKGKLASAKLPPIAECICAEFNDQLNAVTDGKNNSCVLSYGVTSGSDLRSCIKIDKPLAVYIFRNVM